MYSKYSKTWLTDSIFILECLWSHMVLRILSILMYVFACLPGRKKPLKHKGLSSKLIVRWKISRLLNAAKTVRSWRRADGRHSVLMQWTKKYNSRYRNELNQNRLGGKLLDLGKASGIVAFVLYGFDVSLEAAHSADRIRIFKSAAWYALTDD